MSDEHGKSHDFSAAKARLEEIADAVGSDDLSLDDALDLFEEAVALGLQVGNLVDQGILVDEGQTAEDAPAEAPQASPAPQEASE